MSRPRVHPMFGRWIARGFFAVSTLAVLGSLLARFTGWALHPMGPAAGVAILALGAWFCLDLMAESAGYVRAAMATILVGLICAAAEISGLYVQFPFGSYVYTELWTPSFFLPNGKRFPLLLPVAWLILICASYQLAAARASGWWSVLLTGKTVSAIDLVLEPAMTGPVGFWAWETPHPWLAAPVTNCLGWFGVGCLGAVVLRSAGIGSTFADRAWQMLVAVVAFTFVIGVAHGELRVAWAIPVLAFLWLLGRPPLPRRSDLTAPPELALKASREDAAEQLCSQR